MFGIDSSELFILAVLALVFIGPKELPSTMRTVGRLIGRVRAHARHFTAGIDMVMREAELEEMEKRWREENERIMRDVPIIPGAHSPSQSPASQSPASLPAPADSPAMADAEPRLPLTAPAPAPAPRPLP